MPRTMLDRRFPTPAKRAQFDRFVTHVKATVAPLEVTIDPETANQYVLIHLSGIVPHKVVDAIRGKANCNVHSRQGELVYRNLKGCNIQPFIAYRAEKQCSKKEIAALNARDLNAVRSPFLINA